MNTTVVVGKIVDGLFARNVYILANSSQQVSFFLCGARTLSKRVVYVSTVLRTLVFTRFYPASQVHSGVG